MVTITHTYHVYPAAEAVDIAAAMNDNPDDDWTYVVENNPDPAGAKTALIRIYDEDGEFVANL